MAQHDYVIANASGLAVRQDINNALAAVVSNNSGPAAPSTTYAYMWWPDTTTGLLKQRNAANSAWVTVGTLGSTNLGLAPQASPSFTGTATFSGDVLLSGTGYLDLPVGTTAQRPGSPNSGMVRYNTTLSAYEGYTGSTWSSFIVDWAKNLNIGSTFTGQSTLSPDGGSRILRIGATEAGALFTSDIGTAGAATGTQTAVASFGFTYFSATYPTELCITNGSNTVASNIRVYNNGSLISQWTPSGNFQFNSGYGSVATAYGCRAWVNFNGTGTVAIRSSGNVSSITDNGTGDYTINFTTAMPDANYSSCVQSQASSTVGSTRTYNPSAVPTSSSVRIGTFSDSTYEDHVSVNVAIFR